MSHPTKPSILYITPYCPFSQSYGGQLRTLNIARALNRIANVTLLLAEYEDYTETALRLTSEEFKQVHVISLRSKQRWSFKERLRHEIDPRFLGTYRFYPRPQDREFVLDLLEQNNMVWLHGLRSANGFAIERWPYSVLDIDDIPSRVCLSAVRAGSNPVRKALDLRMAMIWKRREKLLKNRFDHITVCSEKDRDYLGAANVTVLPNGFDAPSLPRARHPADPPVIGFIGNLRYSPNVEGVQWFLRDVWPRIKVRVPGARFHLVGDGCESVSLGSDGDVKALGWVADPTDEIASWRLMVVPLKTGGGTRIKIAEAFSRKCPVVSTSLGAYGYDVRTGEEILIADTADGFAQSCAYLVNTPGVAESISEAAWKRFLNGWTWNSCAPIVNNIVRQFPANERGDVDTKP